MVNLLAQDCTRLVRTGALHQGSTQRLCLSSYAVKQEPRSARPDSRTLRRSVAAPTVTVISTSLASRCSQRSSVSAVAQRSFMQIPDSIPEAGNLLRSALPQQMLDLKLKLGNGALATLGPVLKGLRLLESF